MGRRLCGNRHGSVGLSIVIATTIAVALLSIDQNPAVGATPLRPELEELLQHLEKAERSIENIHVVNFSLTTELKGPGQTEWTPWEFAIAGSAWRTGIPESKARVIVTRRVMEWEDGPVPWTHASEDLGYDGRFGRIAHHAAGPLKHRPEPDKTAELLPDAPVLLHNRFQTYADGSGFTLAYLVEPGSKRLSQIVREEATNGFDLKVS